MWYLQNFQQSHVVSGFLLLYLVYASVLLSKWWWGWCCVGGAYFCQWRKRSVLFPYSNRVHDITRLIFYVTRYFYAFSLLFFGFFMTVQFFFSVKATPVLCVSEVKSGYSSADTHTAPQPRTQNPENHNRRGGSLIDSSRSLLHAI